MERGTHPDVDCNAVHARADKRLQRLMEPPRRRVPENAVRIDLRMQLFDCRVTHTHVQR